MDGWMDEPIALLLYFNSKQLRSCRDGHLS